MIKVNDEGGIYQTDAEALKKAKEADLITLPDFVKGTNCYNCKFVNSTTKDISMCNHPEVKQYVNKRMCCALWDAHGAFRPWETRQA